MYIIDIKKESVTIFDLESWRWPRQNEQLHINLKFDFSLTSFIDVNFLRLKEVIYFFREFSCPVVAIPNIIVLEKKHYFLLK